MAFVTATPLHAPTAFSPSTTRRFRPRHSAPSVRVSRHARIPTTSVYTEKPEHSSPSTTPEKSAETAPKSNEQFNWIDQWYPVAYARDVPTHTPFPFTLWDKPLVLYRDVQKRFVIMDDRCPHRAAPLSEGRLFNRKTDGPDSEEETILQCAYHGWCFNCSGTCVDIPTVAKEKAIPKAANIPKTYAMHVGPGELIFVWFGDADKADTSKIRIPEKIGNTPASNILYYRDLARYMPIDIVTNIENLLDPAHVQYAHHGTGQGNRSWMSRLSGVRVFAGEEEGHIVAKIQRAKQNKSETTEYRTAIDFRAPSHVSYTAPVLRKGFRKGEDVILFWLRPVSCSECIIFVLGAILNAPLIERWRQKVVPRWWEHMHGNLVLDGDAYLLQLQELNLIDDDFKQYSSWRDKYILASGGWDNAVVAYRKWIDAHADLMPYDTTPGFLRVDPRRGETQNRFETHTKFCPTCLDALRNFRMLKWLLLVSAAAAAVACVLSAVLYAALRTSAIVDRSTLGRIGGWGFGVAIVCLIGAAIAQWFVQGFLYTERAQRLQISE